eukprot:CAMPEP_0182560162 /NCGR_PEP_ID=MMETSP1324-20130603/2985_1 /TAXON_ID=236786 /ORGANISM="Florenciella sp., Strain RCC1587" /LENGTH=283 /DNA_ID=CAMNT_0024772497 /DNA_START=11 /DNA_END=862 /DNA_ORIENTATION=-
MAQIGTSLDKLNKGGVEPRLTIRRKTPVKSELTALMRNKSLKRGLAAAVSPANKDDTGSKGSKFKRALSSRLISPASSPRREDGEGGRTISAEDQSAATTSPLGSTEGEVAAASDAEGAVSNTSPTSPTRSPSPTDGTTGLMKLASGRTKSSSGMHILAKLDSAEVMAAEDTDGEAKSPGDLAPDDDPELELEKDAKEEIDRSYEHGSGNRRVNSDMIVHGLKITKVDDQDNASVHEEFGGWIYDMLIEGHALHADIAGVVLQVDQELLRMESTFDEFEREDT